MERKMPLACPQPQKSLCSQQLKLSQDQRQQHPVFLEFVCFENQDHYALHVLELLDPQAVENLHSIGYVAEPHPPLGDFFSQEPVNCN